MGNFELSLFRRGNEKFLFIYYLLILILQFYAYLAQIEIPTSIRVIYLGIIYLPTLFYVRFLPFVTLLFGAISNASFYSFFPANNAYLLVILFLVMIFNSRKIKDIQFIIIALFFIFISILHFEFDSPIIIPSICALIVSLYVENEHDIKLLEFSFIIFSLYVSLIYLLCRDSFMVSYGDELDDIVKSGWINSNLFGGLLGIGAVISCHYIFSNNIKSKAVYLLSVVSLVITLFVLILNASRGALFSTLSVCVLFFFYSNIKFIYKLASLLLVLIVVIIAYRYGYFELLLYRLQEGTSLTAGGRIPIWNDKITSFSNLGLYELLFGIGQKEVIELGSIKLSTHNDFITALVGYGFVGFLVFLYFISLPIFGARKKLKMEIMFLLLYLCLECLVLEPLFRGYLPFLIYYVLLYKYSTTPQNTYS